MNSKTTTTKPAKNPKRVAMGKAVAEKSKQAHEEQKQALSEARAIIANNRLELSRQKKLQKRALRKR